MSDKEQFPRFSKADEKLDFNKDTQEWEYMPSVEIQNLEKLMEDMAMVPREEMGKRESGQRCMYEMYDKHGKKEGSNGDTGVGSELPKDIREETLLTTFEVKETS